MNEKEKHELREAIKIVTDPADAEPDHIVSVLSDPELSAIKEMRLALASMEARTDGTHGWLGRERRNETIEMLRPIIEKAIEDLVQTSTELKGCRCQECKMANAALN